MLWRDTQRPNERETDTERSSLYSDSNFTCEFSGGFSGKKRNEVQVEWYETKTIFILTEHSSVSRTTSGYWKVFSALQLYFPAFLLPCTSLLCLLFTYLILQSGLKDHSKGSEHLSLHRKWSILHLSRLKVYKTGGAESQLVARQEAKETSQEERLKIFVRE